ncbi:MAG: T9SS type A sorting domain-containing protein [Crocinitomicaceae bacterium]|nr:T9SS type A sorting domain-containing protein [Crocinitomicaceae bacterium]
MKNSILFLFLSVCLVGHSQMDQIKYSASQNDPAWIQYMYDGSPNLFVLRDMYDAYYSENELKKNAHTQYFKRLLKEEWLNLDTEGNILPRPDKKTDIVYPKSPTSPWEEIGPWDYDHEQAMAFQVQSPGSAHVYTVEQSSANTDLVYAGTATAGLWKSTDKGLNWTCPTKFMDINEVYSIALDPTSVNIVYFGEGNGQLWKSIDGGSSFTETGSVSFQSTDKWFRDVKIIGNNTLLAATDEGLFRSDDAGVTWTNVHAGNHMEIEINPADPTIIYTIKLSGSSTEFYKSIDSGLTWVQKINGWPVPFPGDEQKRTEIAVSAANSDLVYIWTAGKVNGDGGLYGFYKSVDAGENFTFECCDGAPGGVATVTNPNMLGYAEEGDDEGGQYYYDLSVAASPTDADRVFGCGINVWRSLDAGNNWEINAHWVTWVGANTANRYSHADVHDIKFFENGGNVDMWVASDGGLYYSSDQGDNLEPRMHGIHGTDFWGFGAGFKDGYVMVGGTYHNGTLIRYKDIYKGGIVDPNVGGWLAERGGDNYRGFVNYGNHRVGYDDGGSFQFSTERTVRQTGLGFDGTKKCNTSYVTGEYGTYGFNPRNYTEFYSPVGSELYHTTDGGISFTQVHDFGGDKVIQVKVAWSDPNTIYLTRKQSSGIYKIMKSTDAGGSWTDITPTPSQANSNQNRAKYIEVDDKDPNKLWCILMGTQTGNKVFESVDGGNNWQNITSPSIENENVISIVHHYGTEDGLYIGTKKSVYYRNDALGTWVLFNNNLPSSTASSFIEPFYTEGQIRTASQRGAYECDFYEDVPPVAMASANVTTLNLSSDCLPDTVQFVDHSTVRSASATWQWYFEGGFPATSTLENPKVVYTASGSYDVKLVVTDVFGTDSVEIVDFITVTNIVNSPQVTEDFNGTLFPPANWKLIDSEGTSWEHDWPEGDDTDKVASFPNYWVDATDQEHYLVLPGMDFTNAISAAITFDYTYNNNGSYTDSLALVYRTGSQPEWQTLWQAGGSTLSMPGTDVWFWYDQDPTITWAGIYKDLTPLFGESCVEIGFSNIGTNGNHIWIDNVNLFGDFAGISEMEDVEVSVRPNPSNGVFTVSALNSMEHIVVYDITGNEIMNASMNNAHSYEFDLTAHPNGVYYISVTTAEGSKRLKLVKI